MQNKL